tara:strand:- start:244 stop:1533 length:1290 start_codon:yes stop_codon:yes gene_type:complete
MAEVDQNKLDAEQRQRFEDKYAVVSATIRENNNEEITPVPAMPEKGDIVGGEKRNLNYPLDNKDYKGSLTFELVIDPEENKLIQETQRDVRIKQLENENNQRKAELDAIGRTEKLTLTFDEMLAESDEASERRGLIKEGVISSRKKIEQNQEELKKLKGQNFEAKVNLGPNFGDAGAEEVVIPTDPNTRVSLYLPMALNFRDNVSYENRDLGISGAFVEAAQRRGGDVKGLAGVIKGITDGVAETFNEVIAGDNPDLANLALTYVNVITKFPGMEGAEGAVTQGVGVTVNPNTRSLFKNVAIREFAFQFKFIAKSKKEADEVRKIIKFFRTELYPEALTVGTGADSKIKIAIGYKFPKKFIITPMYNNSPIPDTKILPCFLRDVSVVYNPSGQAMHGGDNPHFTEVDMSLAFTETRTLTRQEVEMEGGY